MPVRPVEIPLLANDVRPGRSLLKDPVIFNRLVAGEGLVIHLARKVFVEARMAGLSRRLFDEWQDQAAARRSRRRFCGRGSSTRRRVICEKMDGKPSASNPTPKPRPAVRERTALDVCAGCSRRFGRPRLRSLPCQRCARTRARSPAFPAGSPCSPEAGVILLLAIRDQATTILLGTGCRRASGRRGRPAGNAGDRARVRAHRWQGRDRRRGAILREHPGADVEGGALADGGRGLGVGFDADGLPSIFSQTTRLRVELLGHKTVAEIAWRQLDPATRQTIVDTIRRHPRFDKDFAGKMDDKALTGDKAVEDHWIFQQAATWPDMIRKQKEFDRPNWHYIDLPFFLDPSDRQAFARRLPVNIATDFPTKVPPDKYNVLQALAYCEVMVKSNAGPETKAVAYCWLLHLVGDLHQPLHCTALFSADHFPKGDKGGNEIPLRRGKNLHSLWDGLLGSQYYMPT